MIIGHMIAFDEAEYIEYSIRSVINHLDKLIVIEGSFGEMFIANKGKLYSDDGTIEILNKLKKEFSNLEVYHHNEYSQLKQRQKYFDYCPKEDHWMHIIDADEIYDNENFGKLKQILENTKAEGIKVNSLTFINDFKHYVPIAFPRLFHIKGGYNYKFISPNHLNKNNIEIPITTYENDVMFYHFSYCHSPKRFMEKRLERITLNGHFKWQLDKNGKVYSPGVDIKEFNGKLPAIMKGHPKYEYGKNSKN